MNVVVNNNGARSAPASAQLQAVAPAFFLYRATNYAAANLLPDYAPVADPSLVPGAVAAKPGDVLPFCSELGPPGYAITDLSGNEISDRWQQSLVIKRLAEEAFADAQAAASKQG